MIITQLNLIIGLFTFLLAVYLLRSNYKSKLNIFFSLSAFAISLWVILNYFFQRDNSIFILRAIYALAPFIIISIVVWISYLTRQKASKSFYYINFLLIFISLIFAYLSMTSQQMINRVIDYSQYETGNLFNYFSIFIFILFFYLSGYVIFECRVSQKEERIKFILIIIGIVITSAVATVVSFILPTLGITKYNVLDSASSIFFVIFSFYSISRYKFLNTRILVSEVSSTFLVILSFFQLFVIGNVDILTRLIIFSISLLIASLLIYSVNSESKRLKEIENLNEDLNKATKELKSANIQLKRLDQAKSDFISIASHQLRTPLTAIKGFVSMIMQGDYGKVPQAFDKPLDRVYRSTERIILLVEDLLSISRLESGRMQYEFSMVNIKEIVDDVYDELKQQAINKNLKFEFKKPAQDIPQLLLDKDKIREVFTNLADNAIKYTPAGQVILELGADKDFVRFKVSDTGRGIEPNEMPQLFQKFSRVPGVQQVHTEGTGLGLYIAKNIIEKHGGKIWAESAGKDKGSTFIIELKIKNKKLVSTKKPDPLP